MLARNVRSSRRRSVPFCRVNRMLAAPAALLSTFTVPIGRFSSPAATPCHRPLPQAPPILLSCCPRAPAVWASTWPPPIPSSSLIRVRGDGAYCSTDRLVPITCVLAAAHMALALVALVQISGRLLALSRLAAAQAGRCTSRPARSVPLPTAADWNPQNDLQAMSRAHRIGQKDTVNIYRCGARLSRLAGT